MKTLKTVFLVKSVGSYYQVGYGAGQNKLLFSLKVLKHMLIPDSYFF